MCLYVCVCINEVQVRAFIVMFFWIAISQNIRVIAIGLLMGRPLQPFQKSA